MKPIQWILSALLLALLLYFRPRMRHMPLLRGMFTLGVGAGFVFIFFQETSIRLANSLGIGRGVDLIMYLVLLGLCAACLYLYLRTRELERKLTALVREQALEGLRKAPDTGYSPE